MLPQCTSFPGPQSVIIMNNALIHHDEVGFILFILHKFSDDDSSVLTTISISIKSVIKQMSSFSFYHLIHQTSISLRSSFQF